MGHETVALLATLAMFVVGLSALGFRRRRKSGVNLAMDREVAARDVGFLIFYALAASSALMPA